MELAVVGMTLAMGLTVEVQLTEPTNWWLAIKIEVWSSEKSAILQTQNILQIDNELKFKSGDGQMGVKLLKMTKISKNDVTWLHLFKKNDVTLTTTERKCKSSGGLDVNLRIHTR